MSKFTEIDQRQDADKFESAYSFLIRPCECGSVHIDLFDKEKRRFATVTFDPNEAGSICEDILDAARIVVRGTANVH